MKIDQAEKVGRLVFVLAKFKIITFDRYANTIWRLNNLLMKAGQNDKLVE